MDTSTPRPRHPLALITPLLLLFTALLCSPLIPRIPEVVWGAAGALLSVMAALAWVWRKRARAGVPWGVIWAPRWPLLAQVCAHSCLYSAWLIYWPESRAFFPLLVMQLTFAYLLDMALIWREAPIYKITFGPPPIVMSTNLFLFFTAPHFYWQWPLIAFGFISRELLKRTREGRRVHIFNPSAITLSVAAIALISTQQVHITFGEAISKAHALNPYGYELIFVAGCVVSWLFGVGFSVVSAAVTTLLLGQLYFYTTGTYRYLDTAIPIGVFLGMTLLFTDPATAPRRRDAKALCGVLYGVSVFVLYGALRDLERPAIGSDPGLSVSFFDKLLPVPLLNLLAPRLDALMAAVTAWRIRGRSLGDTLSPSQLRGRWSVGGKALFIASWAALFAVWVRPQLRAHPGRDIMVWYKACDETPAEERAPFACANRDRLYRGACERGELRSCHNLALSLEVGEGGLKSAPLAAEHYERACAGGLAVSCSHLGALYFAEAEAARGGGGAEASAGQGWVTRAEGSLRRACDLGARDGCSRLATLLTSPWTHPPRVEEAWGLWERACDAPQGEPSEPYACLELSQWSLRAPQERRALCAQGRPEACLSLDRSARAEAAVAGGGRAQVRVELRGACEGGFAVACANLGSMMWRGDGGAQELEQGARLVRAACEGGLQQACARADEMRASLSAPALAPTPAPALAPAP
jgi:TPR repeat protein